MNLRMTSRQHGFSLIEVLISMVIIAVGLLGLASLQSKAQVSELEAYQRAQALLLLTDIADTMRGNRLTAGCFAITDTLAGGTPYIGDDAGTGHNGAFTCTASTAAYNNQAIAALTRIDNLLKGAAEETASGTKVGAMIGARACVSYNSAAYNSLTNPGGELQNAGGATLPGTGEYTIAVSWQGMIDLFDLQSTADPAINCSRNLYGDVKKRRVVSMKIRLADLN